MGKKKNTKTMHAAHIKRHTEGTSNELSFSVLDAAKNRADAEDGIDEKAQVPLLGGIRIFSWHPKKKVAPTPTKEDALPLSEGVPLSKEEGSPSTNLYGSVPTTSTIFSATGVLAGSAKTPYASLEEEIERRKSRRRKRRILMAAVVGVLVVAAIGGGGYFLYKEMSNHQAQVSLIDQALIKIEESDKTIVPMDQLINESPDNTDAEEVRITLEGIEGSKQLLDEAEDMISTALASIRDSTEKEAAEQALVAIAARREMLTNGEILLNADLQLENDKTEIRSLWDTVLKADSIAREAAELVTNTTNENVTASIQKTNEALVLFEEAAYLVELLADSPFELDVQNLRDYLSKRIESMHYAIASDEAILAQEREIAESQNEAYNTADAEAVALAKELPEEITQIVTEAYEASTEDTRQLYEEERHKASTADAFLRDYLGT